ncbi:hypothetical protein QTP88_020090 [Uroleucon formosanum]
MGPTKYDRHSRVPRPLRKPNSFSGRIDRGSTHQSNLVFIICSVILQRVEERAIGLYAAKLAFGLGMGITLNCRQETGTLRFRNKLLSISSKHLMGLSGRFFMRMEEIESSPEAGDLLELIAFSSSIKQKLSNQSSLAAEEVGEIICLNFLAVDQKVEIGVLGLSVEVNSLHADNLASLSVLRVIAH